MKVTFDISEDELKGIIANHLNTHFGQKLVAANVTLAKGGNGSITVEVITDVKVNGRPG